MVKSNIAIVKSSMYGGQSDTIAPGALSPNTKSRQNQLISHDRLYYNTYVGTSND